jgi:hypothetical protein
MLRSVGDLIDGSIERGFVRVRWFRESAKFPDELQRGCVNFVSRRGRLKIMQGLDASAHAESLTADSTDEKRIFFSLNTQPSTSLEPEPSCKWACCA